jgi:hypothetical protein
LVYGTGISVLYRRYHQKQEKERKKNTQKEGKKSMRFWQVYGTEILSFYTIVVFLFATVRKKENEKKKIREKKGAKRRMFV